MNLAKTSNSGLTPVELAALQTSSHQSIFPDSEKITTIVVDNFPALGKLAAMRFLEWVLENPEGVISLPTGKTPEHFIRWVTMALHRWGDPEMRAELERSGVNYRQRPDMRGLHFVQIDEFYPIHSWQHNSFYHYVNHYYLDGFGLDDQRTLLMDCSKIGLSQGETLETVWPTSEVDLTLRYRHGVNDLERKQKQVIENIDQWCQEYEDRIRELGGIGFFLGGIGPDGHIGFNVRGSDHNSTTRLTQTNYETQAAAATDLGGIEVSRKRLVITIGLGTITANRNATVIIIAAGEAKAKVVSEAIENEKNVLYPATSLHPLPDARFYLTSGATKLLHGRQQQLIVRSPDLSDAVAERAIIDLALKKQKRIVDLTQSDFLEDPIARVILRKRDEDCASLAQMTHDRMVAKIERGMHTRTKTRFLHTEPHHDDLMLGYLPFIVRHVRDASNTHHFACLTSGFTAVTNRYMELQISRLQSYLESPGFQNLMQSGYFEPDQLNDRNEDVWLYLDGVAANSPEMQQEGAARRLVRNLVEPHDERDLQRIKARINELKTYFQSRYPGEKDSDLVQQLKGMQREWEAECLWGYLGWSCANVRHLRLGFYTGDIFTDEPTVERDVLPVLDMIAEVQPDILSVALDPEASGPDTHYKVLQAVTDAQAIRE